MQVSHREEALQRLQVQQKDFVDEVSVNTCCNSWMDLLSYQLVCSNGELLLLGVCHNRRVTCNVIYSRYFYC